MSQYQVEYEATNGWIQKIPIPDGFLDQIRTQEREKVATELEAWAGTFGDTPAQEAVKSVVREAAARVRAEGER